MSADRPKITALILDLVQTQLPYCAESMDMDEPTFSKIAEGENADTHMMTVTLDGVAYLVLARKLGA